MYTEIRKHQRQIIPTNNKRDCAIEIEINIILLENLEVMLVDSVDIVCPEQMTIPTITKPPASKEEHHTILRVKELYLYMIVCNDIKSIYKLTIFLCFSLYLNFKGLIVLI